MPLSLLCKHPLFFSPERKENCSLCSLSQEHSCLLESVALVILSSINCLFIISWELRFELYSFKSSHYLDGTNFSPRSSFSKILGLTPASLLVSQMHAWSL